MRALRDAGTMNPVILLDEVDKLGADWRGDPSSALLEVLDPAQNSTFRDHYLDLELDLSQVLFLATANVAEHDPRRAARPARGDPPRRLHRGREGRDREAATSSRARDAATASLTDEVAIDARPCGARRRLHARGGRPLARARDREGAAQGRDEARRGEAEAPIAVGADDVRGATSGRRGTSAEAAERTAVAGVATGLAVTGTGGDVLFVEATAMPGKGGLTLTGQLGDVMKESATIALSYVRSHGACSASTPRGFAERDFHIHVPAGAIPKDGPSAGVTMTVALVSLLTGRAGARTTSA